MKTPRHLNIHGIAATPERSERINRRHVIQGAAILGGGLLAGGSGLLGGANAAAGTRKLKYTGVNYDVGTGYGAEAPVRAWHSASMQRDIRAIRKELNCNSIGIHGTDIQRLSETSTVALENGLQVWLQPRLFETGTDEMLAHLSDAAAEAERLRKQYPNVVLNVGCETTLLNAGFIPGATVFERIKNFPSVGHEIPKMQRQLGAVLRKACALSRAKFKGPLTYGAGPWEWAGIDWNLFDFVGLDHYMDAENQATYAAPFGKFAARYPGKPLVVLEFGCCTFEGAEKAGGMGWDIIDHESEVPRLKGDYVRSEQVQAQSIGGLLDLLAGEKVQGAFVYQFVSPELTHSQDPARDLDMASYGVVKVVKGDETSGAYEWEPKLAFREMARRYAGT